MEHRLSIEQLLDAYSTGWFPMAESSDGTIEWHNPDPRAIIPLDNVRISRSLRKTVDKGIFEVTFDTAFGEVIRACSDRDDTWISDDIIDTYSQLHEMGFAHSVESWCDGVLVGGLYGVSIRGAYFGESMFSLKTDSSKVAFVKLTEHMRLRGLVLLDSQYLNPFTEQLGAVEIPQSDYLHQLQTALMLDVSFR